MAISPNDNFIAGQILTAVECNQFPRGVMALTPNTTTNAGITTTQSTQITVGAFTAVAGRNYRVTYYEPSLQASVQAGYIMQIKNGATVLNEMRLFGSTLGYSVGGNCTYVGTFTAGSVTLTASIATTIGTATATRSAVAPVTTAYVLVEDIGTA